MTSLRYTAVLFDLDGTLVDSYVALADAVNFARRAHGLDDLSTHTIRDFVGEGQDRLLQRAFDTEELAPTMRESFVSRYDQVCCSQSRVLDDVENTLAALSAMSVTMAVCTNKPTNFSRKILEYLKLAPHFRAIVGPDLANARKPDGRHVQATLERAGCDQTAALFVGDMPIDIQAARNGGIDVAVVATGSSSYAALAECHPDHFLRRFSDLLHVVRNGADA